MMGSLDSESLLSAVLLAAPGSKSLSMGGKPSINVFGGHTTSTKYCT
jgi:hypothetical protein